MSSEDKSKVWIDGKLITLDELQQKYKQISVAGPSSPSRIIEVLATAKNPLTRQDIADETKLTTGYTRTLLKKMVKQGLLIEFNMKRSNANYYLLTEKGIKSLSQT
jgi:predicted transcriptional regulator